MSLRDGNPDILGMTIGGDVGFDFIPDLDAIFPLRLIVNAKLDFVAADVFNGISVAFDVQDVAMDNIRNLR
jgi:hypothetical protein